jgi:hypothetical protein
MKLERALPITYFIPPGRNEMFVHTRDGKSPGSLGSLWRRSLTEQEYSVCILGASEESVEDVVLSAEGNYFHAKLSKREGPAFLDSHLVTYSVAEGAPVCRISDSELVKLRPPLAKVHVYRLIHGGTSDSLIKCIVWVGPAEAFTESWIAQVNVLTRECSLVCELPKTFW